MGFGGGCKKVSICKRKENLGLNWRLRRYLSGWLEESLLWFSEMCPSSTEVESALTKSLPHQIHTIWTQKDTKPAGQNSCRHTHKHKQHTNKYKQQKLGQPYSFLGQSTSKICTSECMHIITKSCVQTHLLILQTLTFRSSSFHAQNLGVSSGL